MPWREVRARQTSSGLAGMWREAVAAAVAVMAKSPLVPPPRTRSAPKRFRALASVIAQSDRRNRAPIDDVFGSVQGAGAVAGEEGDQVGHLFGPIRAADRYPPERS